MEQHYSTSEAFLDSDQDVSLKQNWKSISSQATVSEDANGCFDCNICFDSAADPVVTLCGHLYCWPCIYKWLHVQISSNEPENTQNCPVCKASITPSSLVPLYGRGTSNSDSESKKSHLGMAVPRRPPPSMNTQPHSNAASALHPSQELHPNYIRSPSHPIYHQQYFPQAYGDFASYAPSYLGNAVITSLLNPTIGMFGETVFTRIFGSVDGNLLTYPAYNNNSIAGNASSRMRRQEMQLDKSLNRVSIFLFCCFIICLLLF